MGGGMRCPSCGESERLVGTQVADDIEVTCQSCGHRWMRGRPRCRGCGGEAAVRKLQLMTRHPRGNQLAVVGHREVPLCPHCDREILGGDSESRTIPEGYVSRFVFGPDDHRPSAAAAGPKTPATAASRTPPAAAPARPGVPPRPATSQARARPERTPDPPTVRQAIDAFMKATPDVDALTMLMLGRHLGPATRLRELEKPARVTALQQWFAATWGDHRTEPRAAAAGAALIEAVDHWRGQGWLDADPVGFLR